MGQKFSGGQGALGIAITTGGTNTQFDRLSQQSEEDRVFTGMVTSADSVIGNLVVGSNTGTTVAAVGMVSLAHHRRNNFTKMERCTAGCIFFIAMMAFDDFDVGTRWVVLQCPACNFGEFHCQVYRQAHVRGLHEGNQIASLSQQLQLTIVQAGGGHHQGDAALQADTSYVLRANWCREIDHHVRLSTQFTANRNSQSIDSS